MWRISHLHHSQVTLGCVKFTIKTKHHNVFIFAIFRKWSSVFMSSRLLPTLASFFFKDLLIYVMHKHALMYVHDLLTFMSEKV